ncbi:MAG: FAD-dependent oxidoreductase, partial [Bacteroidia bacterium]
EPFIRGAYSYSTVGIGKSRSIAAQSVDDKLFFAGEAMNLNGHHQTVHGAAETGLGAVRQILE